MSKNLFRRISVIFLAAVMILSSSACSFKKYTQNNENADSGAITWGTWGVYGKHKAFLDLLGETYPDIKLEFISYSGGNATGYSWAQMRADDIPDIFITSQILDENLAKERLADLSGYDFINNLSTSLLDQISIDGNVYLIPTNNIMYGIFYNKTLMEEHGWTIPQNFAELEVLCNDIRKAGLIPGVVGTQLTGGPFSCVFNLAKTEWLTTPEGVNWERNFLAGRASAADTWSTTMDYVQQYIDIGMLTPDPEDRNNTDMLLDYLGNRKAVFCTTVQSISISEFPNTGDKIGIMPYISKDGSKNVYMYSPGYYFGISKRLTEPGNEKKLENAIKILSLLYSPEGQAAFITSNTPCVMSVLDNAILPEDSMIYDAQQAMRSGRAFPMTYANWENVLSDMGQAYKEWFRNENDMDGPKCIERMDELQQGYLSKADYINFCESTANFTLEETGVLIGKALGSSVGADAVMVPLGAFHDGVELRSGISGKLYAGSINAEVSATITPGYDGTYSMMTMTGAQAKKLAADGFDMAGDGNPFTYILVTKGGKDLEDNTSYHVAFLMNGYTEEVGQTYNVVVEKGSLRTFLREWLVKQRVVSPNGNPWE